MAKDTPKEYRNLILYSVFVRNYSPEGTFEGVRRDLARIRDLGTDVIWLMPIHPIGEKNRKGTLGSPYAIRDYRAVNPEFGTLEDFRRLVDDIHALGMKCVIDVVYNHTSPDSVLAHDHPEWFYRKPNGSMGNHIGDWTDVVDLDYDRNPALWDYQIETLKYWASMVDGFRCDVAPMVPLDFWLRARAEVAQVRPGAIWLAESGEQVFIPILRSMGLTGLSDAELYQAFDLCYDYDTFDTFQSVLEGTAPLSLYAHEVERQEGLFPANYVKLRFLENHDRLRAAYLLPDEKALRNWTAFLYFQKGTAFLYAGQERSAVHRPSLFDKDPVDWSGPDLTPYLQKLAAMKKHPLFTDSSYRLQALPGDILLATHQAGERQLLGVFSTKGRAALLKVPAPDGVYTDLISGAPVEVAQGRLRCTGEPVALETPCAPYRPF